jgi:repressor LexA
LANNIRALRTDNGWSLRELADRMGVHFSTVAKLEKAQRKLTPEWRARFSKAFGVPDWEVDDPETMLYVPIARDWALPVIEQSNSAKWRDAKTEAKEWIGHPDSYNGSDWQFVIRVDGKLPQAEFPVGAFVYVDPQDRDLSDGYYYAFAVEKSAVQFGIYKNDPPRFMSDNGESASTLLSLGHAPFVTVGKVVGIYHRLSLVARGELQAKHGS